MVGVLLVGSNQDGLTRIDFQVMQEAKKLHPHVLCERIEILFDLRVELSRYQVWIVIVELLSTLHLLQYADVLIAPLALLRAFHDSLVLNFKYFRDIWHRAVNLLLHIYV